MRELANRLKDSDNLGSLLRLETDLAELIAEERRKAKVRPQLGMSGLSRDAFPSQAKLDQFFDEGTQSLILDQLDEFVRQSRPAGEAPSHFTAEAAKGLRFFRLVLPRYDVVTTNPPYLSRRNQSLVMARFLDANYPASKSDLYAAFIERCKELTSADGLIGMITQQSFMFISSYSNLRENLRNSIAVENMIHLGPRAFDAVTGEKVNTTAFVFRREGNTDKREDNQGLYFRLVHEPNATAKQDLFESVIETLQTGQPSHSYIFKYRQGDFDAIPEKPWVYWLPPSFREVFLNNPSLSSVAEPRAGMHGGDRFRFARYWWEVGIGRIGRGFSSMEEAFNSSKKWIPYMKGGPKIPWYGNQEWVIAFDKPHFEILKECGNKLPSRQFYFKRGITYSAVTSSGFSARISPGGFIFDAGGSSVFPNDILPILGCLNSRFCRIALRIINPTINIQAGDIARIPIPQNTGSTLPKIVTDCIEVSKQNSRESEETYDFVQPITDIGRLAQSKRILTEYEASINREVNKLYKLKDEELTDIEHEIDNPDSVEDEETTELEGNEEESLSTPATWARGWISYAIGIVLGRFDIGKSSGIGCGTFSPDMVSMLRKLIVADGILVNDNNQPLDLANRIWSALTVMLGDEEAANRIRTALGEGEPVDLISAWVNHFAGSNTDSLWKYHFQQYHKRPVYWPLQSPGKQYTIWIFHECLTLDSLFHIRNDIVETRLRLAEREMNDLRSQANGNRRARKELDRILTLGAWVTTQ
jgi:hypothetical protein